MMNQDKRVAHLESKVMPAEFRRSHLIGQDDGQSSEEARAAYDQPIGPDDLVIMLCGVSPCRVKLEMEGVRA